MFRALKIACALAIAVRSSALAADNPGVTPTEVKVGGIFPFSGPAASIGLVGRGIFAYVQSINDRGGINGRKINYIAYAGKFGDGKIPGLERRTRYRHRLRIEQVHQCDGFSADHDQSGQLRYRRKNLRQVSDQDASSSRSSSSAAAICRAKISSSRPGISGMLSCRRRCPGIRINTSDKINMDFTQMRLQRRIGTGWDQFSDVLDAASE